VVKWFLAAEPGDGGGTSRARPPGVVRDMWVVAEQEI
jgi:hypothetical protein